MFDKPFDNQNPVSKCVIPRDKITVSLQSEEDDSSDSEEWINTFCQDNYQEKKVHHSWFCKIDKSFFNKELIEVTDNNNNKEMKNDYDEYNEYNIYTGNDQKIKTDEYITNAIKLIKDEYKQEYDRIDLKEEMNLQCLAEHIYGLFHAKYILTKEGLEKMKEKFLEKHWGTCPRYYCYNNPVLPYGSSDKPGVFCAQIYCPVCKEVYNSSEKKAKEIDGAYFGPTFAIMFCKCYPELCSSQKPEQTLRIHGFRIADYKDKNEFFSLSKENSGLHANSLSDLITSDIITDLDENHAFSGYTESSELPNAIFNINDSPEISELMQTLNKSSELIKTKSVDQISNESSELIKTKSVDQISNESSELIKTKSVDQISNESSELIKANDDDQTSNEYSETNKTNDDDQTSNEYSETNKTNDDDQTSNESSESNKTNDDDQTSNESSETNKTNDDDQTSIESSESYESTKYELQYFGVPTKLKIEST